MQKRTGLESSRAGVNKSAVAARVVASGMVLLLLAGCSSAASKAAKENDKMSGAFTELMKRPNLIQVHDDYQSMFETIRTRLVDEVGVAPWVPDDHPISGSGCDGDLSHLSGAEVLRMDAGMSPGNLPDAKWDQAVAIVTEVPRNTASEPRRSSSTGRAITRSRSGTPTTGSCCSAPGATPSCL